MKLLTKFLAGSMVAFSLLGCNEKEYVSVGPNWEALYNLPAAQETFKVSAAAGKEYKVGDKLELSASSAKAGKLWIVQVDSKDHVSLLYPNSYERDNSIAANKLVKVPGVESYSLVADEPLGHSVVAFIVTTGNTSLLDVLSNEKNMQKALVLAANSGSWGIAKRVIEVEK